jgi:ABC-type polar amino acid transport system ATPase subunit
LLIITKIRLRLIFYLNGKTTFYKAFNLQLKAINKGNTKIKPSKNTSKTNQNVKKDKHIVYYNFKIFVINKKRQYNNNKKKKQPNKYKLNKELSKQTFIKVNKTINN